MSFAFQYNVFDRDEDGSRKKHVDITVIAQSEAEALPKVKALVGDREFYELDEIVELSDTLHPVINNW